MAPRYLLTSKEAEKNTSAATITRKMTPTMIPNLRMVSYLIFGCDRSERVGYLKYELCSATNSKLQTSGAKRGQSARHGNVQSPYALMLPKDRSQSWCRFVSCRSRFCNLRFCNLRIRSATRGLQCHKIWFTAFGLLFPRPRPLLDRANSD